MRNLNLNLGGAICKITIV